MGVLLAPIENTPRIGGNKPGFEAVDANGRQVLFKSNLSATSDPTTSDDAGAGYRVGSRWINTITGKVWEAVSVATLTAVWKDLTATTPPGGSSGQFQVNDGAGGFSGVGSYSGGVATLPALVANATSGNPLTVQRNGVNAFTVGATTTSDFWGNVQINGNSVSGPSGGTLTISENWYGDRGPLYLSATGGISGSWATGAQIYSPRSLSIESLSAIRLLTHSAAGGIRINASDAGGQEAFEWNILEITKGVATNVMTISSAGATTINAASGNPLTVRGNSVNRFVVDASGQMVVRNGAYTIGGGANSMTFTAADPRWSELGGFRNIYLFDHTSSPGGRGCISFGVNSTVDVTLQRYSSTALSINDNTGYNVGSSPGLLDLVCRSIGLGVAPSGVAGGINGNVLVTSASGTPLTIAFPDSAVGSGVAMRQKINGAYGFDFSITDGTGVLNLTRVNNGVSTNVMTFERNTGATTINAASGNPLTVQANGVNAVTVGSDRSFRVDYGQTYPFILSGYGVMIPYNNPLSWGAYGSGNFASLLCEGSNVVALRSNVQGVGEASDAQTWRIYNATAAQANYERCSIGWNGNTLTIATEAAGSGVVRPIRLGASATSPLGFWNATPIVQPSAAEQVALINNTGGTYDGTLEALPDPTDSPASADALRDDLVSVLLPALRNNFTDLYTQVAAVRTALVNAGLMKGAA